MFIYICVCIHMYVCFLIYVHRGIPMSGAFEGIYIRISSSSIMMDMGDTNCTNEDEALWDISTHETTIVM